MKKREKHNANKYTSIMLLVRLIREFVSPYYSKVFITILFMILVAGSSALHAWLIKPALDEIFFKQDKTMLAIIPVVIIMVTIVKAVASYFQNYFIKYVGQKVITDMQAALYKHLINSDLEFLQNYSTGKIISRFTNDITIMRMSLSNFLTGIAKELLTVIFLLFVMISLNFTLTMIVFIVIPLAVIPIIRLGHKMRRISTNIQEELGKYTVKLDDSFSAIRVIKSYQKEDYEISKAHDILEHIFGFYSQAIKTESLASPIMEILSGVSIALIIWYGGTQVVNEVTSPGTFFAFITAFVAAYKPIKSLADLNTSLQEGLAAANRFFAVLDHKPVILGGPEDIILSSGEIKFEDLSFKYQGNKQAINNLNLIIDGGLTVAFVGKSGSGKTTLSNLLLRFYDPSEGRILIDNQDIKLSSLDALRKNISIVTQDVMLFDSTIRDNITYAKHGATEQEIIEAAKSAEAHEFIMSLPEKYDTFIGQNGFKLSGGQRQRLSIARAILKDAPILILDEATSALDAIAESDIQSTLKILRKGKTTIIIAHRLSTIIDADRIYVMRNGHIIATGTHNELLKTCHEYQKLYKCSLTMEREEQ